jgi:Ca2+-binding RTX toxin-like protein
VYDPFHPSGPSLELTFFTEHLYGIFGSAVGEDEPNETASTATLLTAGQYGVGEITPSGDTDWWVVENVNPGDLVFAYVDTQSSTTSRDSMLRVLADDGTTPVETDADDGPDLSSAVAGAIMPQAGRVLFEVTGPNGGTITQYELYQAVVSPTDSASETEGNNSTGEADPILRTIMTGSVAPGSGDSDYFSFVATTGSRIVVIMDNDPDGDGLATHTDLSVLNPIGNVIQSGDNTAGADGNAAGAIVSAPSSGTYFIRVTNSGAGDDDYRFIVLVLDGGDPLAGAVLMFNVLNAQAQAEQTVDDCLTDIFACDLGALIGSLQFLLNVTPVLAFAGSIGAGLLPVGLDNLSMTSSLQMLGEAEDLLLNCLLDPNCDLDQVLQQIEDMSNQDSTPTSVNMINGGRLPAFSFADTIAPGVTLGAPGLTNDATPTVTVNVPAESGLQNGTPVTLDVDLTGDGDFNDIGELNYQSTTLTNGTVQFDVVPALSEGSRQLRARVSDAAGNEGISATVTVIVDLSGPTLSNIPLNQSVEATSAAGAVVTYALPTASDTVDPNPVVGCSPLSGSTFPLGNSTVTCTATDAAGNLAAPMTFSVIVLPAGPSLTFSSGALTILGTVQDDTIRLVKSGRGFRVDTNFGTLTIPTRKSLRSVIVQARGGNDTVNLALLSNTQIANIDGGAGDDTVTAGAGADIVRGGLGNDQLNGSGGDNLLVGDDGADRLIGGRNSDLLIGGRLNESAGPIDLNGLLGAWRQARTARAKQAWVQGQRLIDLVLDDASVDLMTGDRGIDLFARTGLDQITDLKPEDIA